jgi:hypothetical protein
MARYFPSRRNFLALNKHANDACLYQSRSKYDMVFTFFIINRSNMICFGIHIYNIKTLQRGLLMFYFKKIIHLISKQIYNKFQEIVKIDTTLYAEQRIYFCTIQ